MRRKIQTILFASMISLSFSAMADIVKSDFDGKSVGEVLMKAVNEGSTLADAVSQAIAAAPEKTGDIVAAASGLVTLVSPERCALNTDKKPSTNCSGAIQSAAIAAGADPSVVADASAAGGAAAAGGGTPVAIGGGAAASGGGGGNASAN